MPPTRNTSSPRRSLKFQGPVEVDVVEYVKGKASRADGTPAPTMIMWNGLDSTKEHMYTSEWPKEMAARGISTLMVDCPGSGEALRFHDLKARVTTEDWAGACVDYLETRDDVDHDRIGLVGWSLGGEVALAWARRAPRQVRRLALIATTPCFTSKSGWTCATSPAVLQEFGRSLAADRARASANGVATGSWSTSSR